MAVPPSLDPAAPASRVERQRALLINPFYPKDPHASFCKHVLTPTLALTSVAAATPAHWRVTYWDENLVQGRPPFSPMPEVVGISVHLTFARRAYELAAWYRARGARVALGGLHVLSCPDEAAPHADALAIGDGVQLWPRILADVERGTLASRYTADWDTPYRDDPAPRRDLLPRGSFLTTTSLIATRGCHNRCGFCYLSTDGVRMPYRMRDPEQVVAEFLADGQPYAVFVDNNLGSRPDYLRALCRALAPLERIWSAAVTLDVTDDPTLVRDMALAGCTGVSSASSRSPTRTLRRAANARRARPTTRVASACCTRTASRSTAASCSASTPTAPTSSRGRRSGSRPTVSSARRSTSSRRTRARRCSGSSTVKAESSTATGRATTPPTWCSARSG